MSSTHLAPYIVITVLLTTRGPVHKNLCTRGGGGGGGGAASFSLACALSQSRTPRGMTTCWLSPAPRGIGPKLAIWQPGRPPGMSTCQRGADLNCSQTSLVLLRRQERLPPPPLYWQPSAWLVLSRAPPCESTLTTRGQLLH
uniref:Uncharacterized protein n=1 Tax=Myotis myotis TaxID=51298 RepID=A0A7J7UQ56_MYOMY|nr:hypothetical protein mMyoMyo1_008656 [Myotis myotis]